MAHPPVNTARRMIARTGVSESISRRSRFICTMFRAGDETIAKSRINDIRKEHWDANHHCTAWVIGEDGQFQRSNDDGEPAGTAGTPMLAALRQRRLTDTVAVVTRYFGGIKLGAGGLIRMYGSAVTAAIDAIGVVERRRLAVVTIAIKQEVVGRFEYALRSSTYAIEHVSYAGEGVEFVVHLPARDVSALADWVGNQSNGKGSVAITGDTWLDVPVDARLS